MRIVWIFLAAAALLAAALRASGAPEEDERRVLARVDPRVELTSIVFRLAGNPEYAQGKVAAYTEAIDAKFGKFRDHAVVRRAAALRRQHGVGFDAVAGMAVHLDDEFRLSLPVEKAEDLDRRWPRDQVKPFCDELRAFAKDADFAGFLASQRDLHDLTTKRMQAVLDENVKFAWFEDFFGARPAAKFELALGLANGGCNYGPMLRRGGREELHCILGVWSTDAEGRPSFGRDVVPTVVHEFCHSYCNDLVDAHLDALAPAGNALWPHVHEAMGRQAYGDWKTMMRESLVRACVVRYRAASEGPAAVKEELAEQHGRGFHWTGELSDALAGYEKDRAKHPSLGSFMPKVVEFFGAYAKRFAETAAKAPVVVKMEPANGAQDVDPDLRALVITFDRPMRDGCWAVVGGGPRYPAFPKGGRPSYDAARKVLTVPVELKPAWDYEFWLNRGKFDSFQSEDGVKLASVRVTFRTRAK
jgi:hypothetical protein